MNNNQVVGPSTGVIVGVLFAVAVVVTGIALAIYFSVSKTGCKDDDGCEEYEVCRNGKCVLIEGLSCSTSDPCPAGYNCGTDSLCHYETSTCTSDSKCGSAKACRGGECVPASGAVCSSTQACPTGYACSTAGKCQATTTACQYDLSCSSTGESVCRLDKCVPTVGASCSTSQLCPTGFTCENLKCQRVTTGTPTPSSAFCEKNNQCTEERSVHSGSVLPNHVPPFLSTGLRCDSSSQTCVGLYDCFGLSSSGRKYSC